jgi:predicted secreted hydrolase
MRRLGIVVLSALVFDSCGGGSLRPAPAPPAAGRLSLTALLSDAPGQGADAGFERALAPRPFVFPDDDGPHPAFRSEWWYFTGVLRAPDTGDGPHRFGYEMTIFRQALAPRLPARASAWATRDVYMGHFAIADVDGAGAAGARRFHAYERFARDGLALAGARARPFAVWLDDWRMQGPDAGDGSMPAHLSARDDDGAAIELDVGTFDAGADHRGAGQPIAEGDHGRSVKGPAPGDASYYYSRTSLPTRGRLTLPRPAGARPGAPASFAVSGWSWMDREWSTGPLGAGVRGWDWLGVHLSDGRDLMMYRLRDAGESTTSASIVTLIAAPVAAGARAVRSYGADRFALAPLDFWTSPRSGARYPVSFQLDIPDERIRLVVRPLLAEQELLLAVVYWEGAVSLAGTADGAVITGEGYLELTGYGGGQRQR